MAQLSDLKPSHENLVASSGPKAPMDLTPNTITEFEFKWKQGTASIEDARGLLRKVRLMLECLDVSLAERKNRVSNEVLGCKILQWLWETRLENRNEDFNQELAENLAWFLLAEGQQEFITEWIQVDVKDHQAQLSETGRFKGPFWGTEALAGLIDAHIYWAGDGSATKAIKALRAIDERMKRLGIERAVGYVGPIAAISRSIKKPYSAPIAINEFEWFTNFLREKCRVNGSSSIMKHLALLLLNHPARPDPLPMLSWLEDCYSSRELSRFQPPKGDAALNLGKNAMRAAYILRLQGKGLDAIRLERLVQTHHPVVWAIRYRLLKKYRSDPKLKHLQHRNRGAG